jgi:hypothetical protein
MATGKVLEFILTEGAPRTAVVQPDDGSTFIYIVEKDTSPMTEGTTVNFELDAEGGVADSYTCSEA